MENTESTNVMVRPGIVGPWSMSKSSTGEMLQFALMQKRRERSDELINFPKIRIKQLKYPKCLADVMHTALFQAEVIEDAPDAGAKAGDVVLMRLEHPYRPGGLPENAAGGKVNIFEASPTNALHPFAGLTRLFMSASSRMPGLDTSLHYDVYAYKRSASLHEARSNATDDEYDEFNENNMPFSGGQNTQSIYVIVQSFIVDVDKTNMDLSALLSGRTKNAIFESAVKQFRSSAFESLEEHTGLSGIMTAFDRNSKLDILIRNQPVYRILRAPLAFHLWPQKELCSLSRKGFEFLAQALESSNWPLICFCFSWLMPEGVTRLTPLSTDALCLAQRLLNYPELVTDSENHFLPLREALLCEVFQRTFEESRKAGHTFITEDMIGGFYLKNVSSSHAQFTVSTVLFQSNLVDMLRQIQNFNKEKTKRAASGQPAPVWPLKPPQPPTANDVSTHIVLGQRLLSLGVKYKVLRVKGEKTRVILPEGVKETNTAPQMIKGIYLYDDFVKQQQLEDFFKQVSNRWDRSVHADGCITVDDVFARIAAPPPAPKDDKYRIGMPQWRNRLFLAQYTRLDDYQKRAVANAVLQPIAIMCGIPGAGKTEVFKALFHLFGGAGHRKGSVIPFAAYGRIAAMLRRRLNGFGYTFHRASSTAIFDGESPEGQMLKNAGTWLWDEFGLVTHHHTSVMIAAGSSAVTRIIMAGDENQMDAIGSGSIIDSIIDQVKYVELAQRHPRYAEMSVPHRFMTTQEDIEAISNNTRPQPEQDRAILWNMQQLMRPRNNADGQFDLVHADNKTARLVIRNTATLAGVNATWVNKVLEDIIDRDVLTIEAEAARAFSKNDIQFITQRHVDVNAINNAIFEKLFPSLKDQKFRPLRRFERICCTKNGYFMRTSDESGGSAFISDAEIERIAMAKAMRNDLGVDNNDDDANGGDAMDVDLDAEDGDLMGPSDRKLKRQMPDRDDTLRGTASDDVFNGDIKMISRIVDVDRNTGGVVAEFTTVKEGRMRYSNTGKANTKSLNHVARVLIFDDNTQLNLSDDYDVADVTRAYCITSKKMQGSQAKIVVNYFTPANGFDEDRLTSKTLYCEEFYTNKTRAELRFFAILPTTNKNMNFMLEALRDIAHNKAPRRYSTIGQRLPEAKKGSERD